MDTPGTRVWLGEGETNLEARIAELLQHSCGQAQVTPGFDQVLGNILGRADAIGKGLAEQAALFQQLR